MATEDNRKGEFVAAGYGARHTQTNTRLPAPGMTTIEVDAMARGTDVISQTQSALKVLYQGGIKARRRARSLATKALVQVADADAERPIHVLAAAQMQAVIRPS
jgi:hypothetical protein